MKTLIDTNPDPYARRFKVAKWNRMVTVCDVPRLFSRLPEFNGWDRAKHESAAREYLAQAKAMEQVYWATIESALKAYGDHGPLISGIIRDHFPEQTKIALRESAQRITAFRDRSLAHWLYAGKRLHTWRRLNETPDPPFKVGDRVELHPGTDLWMRGARFGDVACISLEYVWVRLDKVRKLAKLPHDRVTKR